MKRGTPAAIVPSNKIFWASMMTSRRTAITETTQDAPVQAFVNSSPRPITYFVNLNTKCFTMFYFLVVG